MVCIILANTILYLLIHSCTAMASIYHVLHGVLYFLDKGLHTTESDHAKRNGMDWKHVIVLMSKALNTCRALLLTSYSTPCMALAKNA